MNASQIMQTARAAGWPDNLLAVATAIALAESGGNANAHNPKPPDDSYGLWQINMLGKLGPERRAAFGIARNVDLYDPLTNARAALQVYKWQGFRAWSVYLNGAYRKFLPAAQAAATGSAPVVIERAPVRAETEAQALVVEGDELAENQAGTFLILAAVGLGLYLWLR